MLNSRFNSLVLLLSFLLFSTSGCGPTVDTEKRNWERHQSDAERFTKKFPALQSAIELQIKTTATAMEGALKETDEKKKAQKMREANQLAKKINNPIRDVLRYQDDIKASLKKIEKMDNYSIDLSDDARALATKTRADVSSAIRKMEGNNSLEDAREILKAQIKYLKDAKRDLKEIYKDMKPKKRKKKKRGKLKKLKKLKRLIKK